MSDEEFDATASAIAGELRDRSLDERIAGACRGSANPAALAWLAEALGLGVTSRVVDLGSGLGGPAAWIARRYLCPVVIALEPAAGAAHGAVQLFAVPVVRGAADQAPFRSRSFDASLVLGVLSVVAAPVDVLREARRVSGDVGILEYCSTNGSAVTAGGSVFPTPDGLEGWVEAAGLVVSERAGRLANTPVRWREAAAGVEHVAAQHPEAAASEAEVTVAIETGKIEPRLLVAQHG